ncbi:hypothetical protein ExPCM20_04413 [Escherichia coli]|nr:hypothetical protein ExPCM20_04413 [Escherichia coli]
MTKNGRANGARDEGDGEGGERLERCCRRIALWEEDMRKHNNGRSGVNVKVEKLNGRANERGDKDFITRVDRRVFLLVVECCGCCLHNLFLFFG